MGEEQSTHHALKIKGEMEVERRKDSLPLFCSLFLVPLDVLRSISLCFMWNREGRYKEERRSRSRVQKGERWRNRGGGWKGQEGKHEERTMEKRGEGIYLHFYCLLSLSFPCPCSLSQTKEGKENEKQRKSIVALFRLFFSLSLFHSLCFSLLA